MSNVVLECYDLSKSYHDGTSMVSVLHGANLQVRQSEMIAVVGNSGSGKSTLLHLLVGLDKPTGGHVLLLEQDFATLSEKAKCQYVTAN